MFTFSSLLIQVLPLSLPSRLPSGCQAPRCPWQPLQLLLPGRGMERRVQPLRAATDRYQPSYRRTHKAADTHTLVPARQWIFFFFCYLQTSWMWRGESPSTSAAPPSRISCPSLRPCSPANTGREYRCQTVSLTSFLKKRKKVKYLFTLSALSRRDEDSYQKFIPFIGVRFNSRKYLLQQV